MTDQNPAIRWARSIVDELAAAGVAGVCIAPGSRSTPLTVAASENPDLPALSLLDERSAAFFALGRAKRGGEAVALLCTSGTAAAEFHPAVIEADLARVPIVVLTADRPPELRDSGANQTIDQTALYGGSTRWTRTLPEPSLEPRTLRMLRTTIARAVMAATGTPPGPVHLNVPFRKPLTPTDATDLAASTDAALPGRDPPFVAGTAGTMTLDDADVTAIVDDVRAAERGVIVAGPAPPTQSVTGLLDLIDATGFPTFADPLSGLRFHPDTERLPLLGGYDGFLDEAITHAWPSPDLVLRVGASPTSRTLREYLQRVEGRQLLIDPAGAWREATFTVTDLVTADVDAFAGTVARRLSPREPGDWQARFRRAEARYWSLVAEYDDPHEGAILADVVEAAPDPATIVVSNSMPVRDLDRFGRPAPTALTVMGNRGASGIDGVTSTALGAASTTNDPVILVTGDLAYYHDMNGLLAIDRCDVDATIVEINNDGGGIFHMLPIEAFDPPFTEHFKTPHGLDFAATASLYDLEFTRVTAPADFAAAYRSALAASGTVVLEITSDAERSHRTREAIQAVVRDELSAEFD